MKKIPYDKTIFRDSGNRQLTIGLFKETVRADNTSRYAIFSLEDWRKVYLELEDVTEYKPAMALVGDWDHWCTIRNNQNLKPYFDAWQKEVEAALRCKAVDLIKQHAESQGGTAAAKWLAEEQYKNLKAREPKKPVGRPEKEEENTTAEDNKKIEKDLKRLQLVAGSQ